MAIADKIDYSATRSASLNSGSNPVYMGIEWRSHREPDYHVYVYNLSGRTFEDASGRGMIGRISLRAPGITDDDPTSVTVLKKNGKKLEPEVADGETKWHYVTSFPQPVLISKFNDESNEIGYQETDAVRFVVDQIHPDNPSRSLDFRLPNDPRLPQSSGNNFADKGVFFSLHNPPLKEDVDAARKRMERYYTYLLERAGALELSDEKQLSEELRSNPDYGYAAQYFGRAFKWNKKNTKTTECPNCGEQKPANRLFHMSSFGLCVEQTSEAWKAAVLAGVKNYDSVPEELRWRKEPKSETK